MAAVAIAGQGSVIGLQRPVILSECRFPYLGQGGLQVFLEENHKRLL